MLHIAIATVDTPRSMRDDEGAMTEKPRKSITEIFQEGTEIDRALRLAAREAILFHKRIGNPIAVWEDGKVVWIQPEDIRVEDIPIDDPRAKGEAGEAHADAKPA
jgi:hypothetical protein